MSDLAMRAGDPNDLRFQFEIIRQLAENGRVMAQNISDVQKTQVAMLERLAKIESNTVNETVAKLDTRVETMTLRVDKLEQFEDRRAGETAMKAAVIKWWPVIGMAILVVWTAGRALGFFHLPEPPRQEPRPAIVGTVK